MQQDAAAGFSLIEVLVALVVLSVGMIGVAALHGTALAASAAAFNRSEAVLLAGAIAEAIRGNRAAGAAYAGAAAPARDCGPTAMGAACSPAELAADDLVEWRRQIARSLPGGRGRVEVDSGALPAVYEVTVDWEEPAAGRRQSFSFGFGLAPW